MMDGCIGHIALTGEDIAEILLLGFLLLRFLLLRSRWPCERRKIRRLDDDRLGDAAAFRHDAIGLLLLLLLLDLHDHGLLLEDDDLLLDFTLGMGLGSLSLLRLRSGLAPDYIDLRDLFLVLYFF